MKTNRIFTYILSISGAVLGFVLNILLARVLTLEQLDKVKYLVSLVNLISSICVIGLPSFMTREINNDEKHNEEIISKCFSLYFGVCLFIAPIIYYILFNFVNFTTGDFLLSSLSVVASIFFGAVTIISAILLGRKKFNKVYLLETIVPKGTLILLVVIFALLHLNNLLSNFYLFFYLVIYLCIALLFLIKDFKKIIFNFSKNEIKTICVFYSISIAQVFTSHMSTILQGNMFPNIVGVISTISTSALLMGTVNVFTNVLSSMTRPLFAEFYKDNKKDEIIDMYRYSTRTNLYFSIPVYLFFAVFPGNFLSIFNPELVQYSGVFVVSVLTNFLSNFCGTTGAMLAMTGHEKKQLINTFVQFLAFIVSVIIFKNNAIYGIVLSIMVAEIIITIIKFVEVGMIFRSFPFDSKTLLSMVLVLVIDGALIFGFSFIKIQNIFLWFLIAILFGAVLLVTNVLISPLGKHDIKKLIKFGGEKNVK